MPEIGRWNNLKFEVSPSVIRSFNDLQIKSGSETETVEENEQQYVKRKNQKPTEVSLTVQLHAGLGYDVNKEANQFLQAAFKGNIKSYFYVGSKKLVPCPLMLTEATISRVMINSAGNWIEADVALSFKQASLLDGTIISNASASGSSTLSTSDSEADDGGSTKRLTAATVAGVTAAVVGLNKITKTAKIATKAAITSAGVGAITGFKKRVQ